MMNERIDRKPALIEQAGLMLREKTDETGIISVSPSHIDEIEAVFEDLLNDGSFKSVIEETEPDFSEGAYLIFSPHVSPSLAWISGEYPSSLRLGEDRELSKSGYTIFSKPHYCLFPSGNIFALVDEDGEFYLC